MLQLHPTTAPNTVTFRPLVAPQPTPQLRSSLRGSAGAHREPGTRRGGGGSGSRRGYELWCLRLCCRRVGTVRLSTHLLDSLTLQNVAFSAGLFTFLSLAHARAPICKVHPPFADVNVAFPNRHVANQSLYYGPVALNFTLKNWNWSMVILGR